MASLDAEFKKLHKGSLPTVPNMVTITEHEVKEREQLARTLLCIESSRRWLEDAAIEMAETLEKMEGVSSWGKSIAEMVSTMRSLSTLTLDRLTTELTNSMLRRRDMWLRTLQPRPTPQVVETLRRAPLDSPMLFGSIQPEFVEKELVRRKDEG